MKQCSRCGQYNADEARFCSRCGWDLSSQWRGDATMSDMQPQTAIPVAPKINTYLVPSILVTLFCCLPLGVAAIVFSAIAHGQVKSGNIEEALKNANIAKVLCWIGFGLGLAFIALYTIGLTLGGY